MYKDKEKAREYARKRYQKLDEEKKEQIREQVRKWHKDHPGYSREYNRRRYKEKSEEIKEYCRKYYQENIEKCKERSHQYWQDHPEMKEKKRESSRRWRAEHVDHHREYCRKRYSEDPVYRAASKFKGYRWYDSHTPGIPSVDPSDYPTRDEYVRLFMQPCVFCGETDWHKIGLDRIDNTKGHTRDNLQPCCWSCNSKKKNMSVDEFRQAIADGRIKLKTVKAVKTDADTAAVPAMPRMRSLLSE